MALSPIRKITSGDVEALNASAHRFMERHGITLQIFDPEDTQPWEALGLELEVLAQNSPTWRNDARNWHRCFCRALKVCPCASVTIAYGYVGHRCP